MQSSRSLTADVAKARGNATANLARVYKLGRSIGQRASATKMKVRLKTGWSKAYPEFTVGNVYRVLGIENDWLRIVNHSRGHS